MDTSLRGMILLLAQVPLFGIVILLELMLSNFKFGKYYSAKETLQNVYLSLCNFGIDAAVKVFTLWVFILCYQHNVFSWESHGLIYWVSLIVLEDFMFYWLHRNDHFIRFFWATHVTHHSAEHYNFTVGFRSSVFEPLYRFVYFIPILFLGYAPLDVMFVFSATQIWGTLVHTRSINKLGWFEHFFVTPSHHRVHHGSNPKYLDKNMGMFLIIWDKMFGTFQKELDENEYEPIRYGLTHNLENPNWIMLIFHEFVDMAKDVTQKGLTATQRWNYLFGKPGYSHDGSRMTSNQMREAEGFMEEEIVSNSDDEILEESELELSPISFKNSSS